jgi:hypothetical protein
MTERSSGRNDVADALLQLLQLGKPPFPGPRPNHAVIEADVEDPTRPRHKRYLAELCLESREQLLSEPGGAKEPAALRAVFDFEPRSPLRHGV